MKEWYESESGTFTQKEDREKIMGSAHTTICKDTSSAFNYSDAFGVETDRKYRWYDPTMLSYNCSTTVPATGRPMQLYKSAVNWYFVMLVSVVGLWILFHVAKAMTKHMGGGEEYTAAFA